MAITSTSDYEGRAKLSSSTSDTLFALAYGDPGVDAATGDAAWVRAMLDVESALAAAGAGVGVVPAWAAAAIQTACAAEDLDLARLADGAGTSGTPVISLVAQLRERVPQDARPFVHLGATSQDVLDTALVLLARRAVPIALGRARAAADLLAELARTHRDTLQVGRTLLQHGAITTFGLVCAVRLVGVDSACTQLETGLAALPVQLGGAAGTLALDGAGLTLLAAFAEELGLPAPVVPWHPARGPVARLATAAGVLAGELAGVAQDLVLLAATEIGEVTPGAPGSSSAMPHKRNPSRATLALACAHRVPGLVATVLAGMPQELQRSPGRWQAEWGTLTELLRLLGGTARHTAGALDGAVVQTDRMASHVQELLAGTGGSADPGAAAALVGRALASHTLASHTALQATREATREATG